jgi:hypothetical protein
MLSIIIPMFLFSVIAIILKILDNEQVNWNEYAFFYGFFVFILLFEMEKSVIVIEDDKILTKTNKFYLNNEYTTYLIKDIVSFNIKPTITSIQFKSNQTITRLTYFYSKTDREFLKQLLLEKVPVKPS